MSRSASISGPHTRVELTPDPGTGVAEALLRVLEQAGHRLDGAPAAYRSAWTAAAREEAIEQPLDGYTRSPRSTPGATRA